MFINRSTSNIGISDYVNVHITKKSGKEVTANTLKWVHTAIVNARRTLLGILHKIKDKYLLKLLGRVMLQTQPGILNAFRQIGNRNRPHLV
ncbi:hypothetical protein [Sinomicrobium oceani]|uniref:hypothetical protein n=1 Tax=Sinomicrobium oceani TaxID=1150368 RepID=UPI0038B55A56